MELAARWSFVFTIKGIKGRSYVSNCTFKMLYPIHTGEKTGFVGEATHRSGSEK
jgi:hypothetical protein